MAKISVGKSIGAKQLLQREQLWPGMSRMLWDRSVNKGFATIPKTMPIILQIMDDLSSGKPLSSTYLGLWCETWDNSMVNITKTQDMAYSAGFTGQRAQYTWGARMQLLQQLEFIDIKPGRSGPISHVLILNPHMVIRHHKQLNTPHLDEARYNALLERAVDIGANDMLGDFVWGPTPPAPSIVTAPIAATPAIASAPSAESTPAEV